MPRWIHELSFGVLFCGLSAMVMVGCHDSSTGDGGAGAGASGTSSSSPFAGKFLTLVLHNTQNNLLGKETNPQCGDEPCEETVTLTITGDGDDIDIEGTLTGCDGDS